MPMPSVTQIKINAVTRQHAAHKLTQVALRSFHHQVRVIRHQTVKVQPYPKQFYALRQPPHKLVPIPVLQKQILPTHAAKRNMVNGAFKQKS
jgi:hypothetical protein